MEPGRGVGTVIALKGFCNWIVCSILSVIKLEIAYINFTGNHMSHVRTVISILSLCLFCLSVCGQKKIVDSKDYRLDKTVKQFKTVFKFWVGKTGSTSEKLIVERIYKKKTAILYNDFIRDGIYNFADMNNDGYRDFITTYHDFDVIYFFNPKTDRFKKNPVYMPLTFGLIDNTEHIYWGYRDAQYAEAYDYSILYRYVGFTPFVYYKLVYKAPEEYSERKDVNQIELYKFKNNDYAKPIFVRRVKTKNPSKFDYAKFWKANYKRLLDQR